MVSSFLLSAAIPAAADPQLVCEDYANYAGKEPPGYSEQCLGRPYGTPDPSMAAQRSAALGSAVSSTAFKYQMVGFAGDVGLYSYAITDFSDQAFVSDFAIESYGWDFDSAGVLWAHKNISGEFGTVDTETGEFTLVSTVTLPNGENFSGLTIDPITDVFYVSGTTNSRSTLYVLDPSTGELDVVGDIVEGGGDGASLSIVIDLAMNCDGELYVHDVGTDALYQVNPSTAEASLVGKHGYDANFAQGMDFDNADGTLYGCIYMGSGSNVYGTWDTITGKVTPLNTNDPEGEWECAIPNPCPTPELTLVKFASPATYERAGDIISYTFTVTNTGEVTLEDVEVNDPQLGGFVPCKPTTLAPGESTSCGPVDYEVTPADIEAGEIVNTATAAAIATTARKGDLIEADHTLTVPRKTGGDGSGGTGAGGTGASGTGAGGTGADGGNTDGEPGSGGTGDSGPGGAAGANGSGAGPAPGDSSGSSGGGGCGCRVAPQASSPLAPSLLLLLGLGTLVARRNRRAA